MRIEILLDLPASGPSSFDAPWKILLDGRPTEPSLTSIDEVIECLMRLGVEPADAQWHASRVTRTTPRHEFALLPRTT